MDARNLGLETSLVDAFKTEQRNLFEKYKSDIDNTAVLAR